jgi:hypothetical protein
MHGSVHIMTVQLRHEEIRRAVAADHLGRKLLAARKGESRLTRNLGWELARYAGLLSKHLRKVR